MPVSLLLLTLTAANEGTRLTIVEGVVADGPAAHLVVKVNSLNGGALHTRANSIPDVFERGSCDRVVHVDVSRASLTADVKCASVGLLCGCMLYVVLLKHESDDVIQIIERRTVVSNT